MTTTPRQCAVHGEEPEDLSGLCPYYLVVTFWGQKYREYFSTLCLPSLLAPNNAPVLQRVRGSKLIVATTSDDWAALGQTPLFQQLSNYVQPYFINIGYPPPGVAIQLHMSKGHVLAARKAYEDGAYAGFLAPDLLLADGVIGTVVRHAAAGKKAVLAQALRFAMEPVVEALQQEDRMRPGEVMVLEPRFIAGLATRALHSEILRYDFEGPHFENYPIWSYWRVPGRECLVMHTVSWALLLGSYKELGEHNDDFLSGSTIDGFYVYRNFAHLRDKGQMHMITDSDEAMIMSLTPEAEMSFPLRTRPNDPGAYRRRLLSMHRFLASDVLDPFRRWAYQIPCLIHGDDLNGDVARVASTSVMSTAAALVLMGSSDERPQLGFVARVRAWAIDMLRGLLRPVAAPLVVMLLGGLSRAWLRRAFRLVPRPFVRSVMFRLTYRPQHLWLRQLLRDERPRESAMDPIRRLLRPVAAPLVGPLLGWLPRAGLRCVFRLVPRPFVRSVMFRLTHRPQHQWLRQMPGDRQGSAIVARRPGSHADAAIDRAVCPDDSVGRDEFEPRARPGGL